MYEEVNVIEVGKEFVIPENYSMGVVTFLEEMGIETMAGLTAVARKDIDMDGDYFVGVEVQIEGEWVSNVYGLDDLFWIDLSYYEAATGTKSGLVSQGME